jgi:methionine-rich copper-binding protein CopC
MPLGIHQAVTSRRTLHRVGVAFVAVFLIMANSASGALAHSYPQTTNPAANARLDAQPSQITINYDGPIAPSGSSMILLDSTDSSVLVAPSAATGNKQASIQPMADLAPGPYTVNWTSLSGGNRRVCGGCRSRVLGMRKSDAG